MSGNSTYQHARRLGAGADLTDGTDRFLVSDYSPGTGDVYGWRLKADGTRGAYTKLPADLTEIPQSNHGSRQQIPQRKAFPPGSGVGIMKTALAVFFYAAALTLIYCGFAVPGADGLNHHVQPNGSQRC